MNIIIDAYNLLKQLIHATIGERERTKFINSMRTYAQKKQHQITIVFDGGSYQRPYLEEFDDVTVVYSGFEMTADDYIKKLLPKLHANNALIVTSDRAICRAANAHDITTIDPHDFMRFVHQSVNTAIHSITRSKGRAQKLETKHDESIDALMEKASTVILDKDQMIAHDQSSEQIKKNKPSKIERKHETIVKKL